MAQMRVGCLAGLVLSASLALALPTGAAAQTQSGQAPQEDAFLASEDGWDTYVNSRFGMRLTYPGHVFSPAEAPPGGDGRRFEADDARIEVSAWRNEAGVTPSELAAQLTEGEGYQELIRHEIEDARLILSGYRADQVFHQEYHFEGATVQALGMEYPVERRATYEPVADRIAALFIPGTDTSADEPAEELGEPPSHVARPADPEPSSSDETQATAPQASDLDETAAADAPRPEIAEEPPAQPAEEAAAQIAEEAPAEAGEEAAAQPTGQPPTLVPQVPTVQPAEVLRVEPTVPVRPPRVAGTRGEGGGTGSGAGSGSSGSSGADDGSSGGAGASGGGAGDASGGAGGGSGAGGDSDGDGGGDSGGDGGGDSGGDGGGGDGGEG